MKLTIENLLCYPFAEVEIFPGVSVIAGKNATGKSSLASIISAVVANHTNPAGIRANLKKAYIMDGRHDGEARLEDDEGNVVIWRPTSGMVRPDIDTHSTPEACGLVNFIGDHNPDLWESLFLDRNPRELLEPAWTNRPAAQLDEIVKLVEDQGWKEAAKIYVDHRAKAGSDFCDISGQRQWGDRQSPNWKPKNWDAVLDTMSESELMAELTNAEDIKRAIEARRAVTEAEVTRAQDAKIRKEHAQEDLRKIMETLEMAAPEAHVRATLQAEQENRARLLKATAISGEDIKRGKAALEEIMSHKSNIGVLEQEVDDLVAEAEGLKQGMEKAQADGREAQHEELKCMALITAAPEHKCPGCNLGLNFEGGSLIKWDKPEVAAVEQAKKDVKKHREVKAAAEKVVREGVARLKEIQAKRNENKLAVANFEGTIATLRDFSLLADAKPQKGLDQNALDACEKRIAQLEQDIAKNQEARREANELRGQIRLLEEQSALADEEPTDADLTAQQIAGAENEIQRAKERLDAWQKMRDARRCIENRTEYDFLAKLLGSEGVRQKYVASRLGKFNGLLKKIAEISGWPTVQVTPSYDVLVNGRPVQLVADSEKQRAQWSLQIVFARMTHAQWIVLDKGDILKDESWDGLLTLADDWGRRHPETYFVMCATSPPSFPGTARVLLVGSGAVEDGARTRDAAAG